MTSVSVRCVILNTVCKGQLDELWWRVWWFDMTGCHVMEKREICCISVRDVVSFRERIGEYLRCAVEQQGVLLFASTRASAGDYSPSFSRVLFAAVGISLFIFLVNVGLLSLFAAAAGIRCPAFGGTPAEVAVPGAFACARSGCTNRADGMGCKRAEHNQQVKQCHGNGNCLTWRNPKHM